MQQEIFSFSVKDKYNQNEFIESESNREACHVINDWPKKWGVKPYEKALIIKGKKHCGKTFLAKKWAQISAAYFIETNLELPFDLLAKYHCFIIENFDLNWSETKLFHLFNLLMEHDKYILMSCNILPKFKLPDLSSRIRSLNVITINEPDDLMMEMLIFKLFSNYSIIIEPEIISFLLKHLPRNFPAIINSIDRINQYALEHKRKITIPLIKKILSI